VLDGEVVGAVVRTQKRVKPVFVSVGHRVDLATAVAHTLHLTPSYRIPETTRAADHACRAALKS
jgi:deoxyribonuclease V